MIFIFKGDFQLLKPCVQKGLVLEIDMFCDLWIDRDKEWGTMNNLWFSHFH